MRRVHKFLNLSSTEQQLLIKTWILLGLIRLGVTFLPFSILRKFLYKFRFIFGGDKKEFPGDRLVWSVGVVSHYIPKATCLVQAITTQFLLQQAGHQACLHIGVTEAEKGRLKAHAWVESQGKVLIGGIDLNQYTHLLALE